MMKYCLLLFLCLMPVCQAAEESVAVLDAEFWFMPRHGDVVAEHYGVRTAVVKLIAEPEAYLALRYPDDEAGELWGQELRAWLVSLGIVSDRIELQPGYEEIEGVALVVVAPDRESAESLPVTGPNKIDEDATTDMTETVIADEVSSAVEAIEKVLPVLVPTEQKTVQKDIVVEE